MNFTAERRPRTIESRHNARIKELRSGLRQGGRTAQGRIALEGEHLLQEAIRSGLAVRTVFVRRGGERLLQRHELGTAEVLIVTEEAFTSAAATEHPQEVAALVDAPKFTLEEIFRGTPLVVVAAGLQDPGNLGTLLRSAEAFGATGMITLPGTVSPWNGKVMRASSGSVFRLPVVSLRAEEAFTVLRARAVRVFAAIPRAGDQAWDLRGPAALLLGNEGAGLPPQWIAQADARITVPCPGPVESLNTAVAGSLLLYDAARQRRRHEADAPPGEVPR